MMTADGQRVWFQARTCRDVAHKEQTVFHASEAAAAAAEGVQPPPDPVKLSHGTFKHAAPLLWDEMAQVFTTPTPPRLAVLWLDHAPSAIGCSWPGMSGSATITFDGRLRATVVDPLIQRVQADYGPQAHVILTPRDVWVSDAHDAQLCLLSGAPPFDPVRDQLIQGWRFLERSTAAARMMVFSEAPAVRLGGLITCVVMLLGCVVALASAVFACYMLARGIEQVVLTTLLGNVDQSPAFLRWARFLCLVIGVALPASALTILFFPPARAAGWAALLSHCAINVVYARGIGVGRGDPPLIVALWVALFLALATLPFITFVYCATMVWCLWPLVLTSLAHGLGGQTAVLARAWSAGRNAREVGPNVVLLEGSDGSGARVVRAIDAGGVAQVRALSE
jgi:hypothetical protein